MGSARERTLAFLLVVAVALAPAAALFVTASAAPSPSSDSAPSAGAGWMNVSAVKDYAFEPPTFQFVPTNATVSVALTDLDVLQHSLLISSRAGYVIPTSDTTADLNALFHAYPAMVNVEVNYTGDQETRTFHSPTAPGWYEFICNVSGHFENGMYGFVAFGEALPSNLTAPSRTGVGGSGFTSIDAAAAGVVGVVLLLAVVFLYRRQQARRRAQSRSTRTSRRTEGPQNPRP